MTTFKQIWLDTKYLVSLVWSHGKLYVILNAISSLVAVPLGLVAGVSVAQAVIDRILVGSTIGTVLGTVCSYFLMFALSSLLQNGVGLFYSQWKQEELTLDIQKELFRQILKTDQQWLDKPEFYTNVNIALGIVPGRAINAVSNLTQILGMITGSLAMMGVIARTGILLAFIILAGFLLSLWLQAGEIKAITKQIPEDAERIHTLEHLSRIYQDPNSTFQLKSTHLQRLLNERFSRFQKEHVTVVRNLMIRGGFWSIGSEWAKKLMDYVVVIYAAIGLFSGRVDSVGVFATLIAAAGALSASLAPVSMVGMMIQMILQSGGMLHTLYEMDSPIENSTGISAPEGNFSLEFNHVSFAYPNSTMILKDVCFRVMPGEHIAVVGENGTGKSTLVKLLLRLYDTNEGEILVNGKSIREYDVHELREKIGTVLQQSEVYPLTLRDNLRFYGERSDEEMRSMLVCVGLEKLVDSLDREMSREYDADGIVLSGGEMQRLALARTLLGTCGMLLLDEPSSAMDPLAEDEMTHLLYETGKVTTIMIAHRLGAIRYADRIYLISDGMVAEQGTHDELMALNGKYAEMFRRQAENYTK